MRERLIIAGVLAGVAALVAAVFVVLQFGRHNPSPPSLEDEPNPAIPGEILYQSDTACMTRALASGERREQICWPALAQFGGPFTWYSDHEIATTGTGGVPTIIDLDTGEQRASDVLPESAVKGPYDLESPSGEVVTVDEDGKVYVSRGTERELIRDFDVSRYRQPQPIGWSPDGAWILLSYYPTDGDPELWILSRDGSVAGTLATDFQYSFASWRIDGVGTFPALVPVTPP